MSNLSRLAQAIGAGDERAILDAIDEVRARAPAFRFWSHDGGISMSPEEIEEAIAARDLAQEAFPHLLQLAAGSGRVVEAALTALVLTVKAPPARGFPTPPPETVLSLAPLLESAEPRWCFLATQVLHAVLQPASEAAIEGERLHLRATAGEPLDAITGSAIALLGHEDRYVVSMAAVLLGHLRCAAALPALRRALPRSPEIVGYVLVLLGDDDVGAIASAIAGGLRPTRTYSEEYLALRDLIYDGLSCGISSERGHDAGLEHPDWMATQVFELLAKRAGAAWRAPAGAGSDRRRVARKFVALLARIAALVVVEKNARLDWRDKLLTIANESEEKAAACRRRFSSVRGLI